MMHPMLAFTLYLVLGSVLFFIILLIGVRVSVYVEENCPTGYCKRRKQRQMEKKFIRRILNIPDESPRPGNPPSQDNITAEVICQNYIYEDAISTGLTGSEWLTAVVAYPGRIRPLSILEANSNGTRDSRQFSPIGLDSDGEEPRTNFSITMEGGEEGQVPEGEVELEGVVVVDNQPPPSYHHVTSVDKGDEDFPEGEDEPPPPSYSECMRQQSLSSPVEAAG